MNKLATINCPICKTLMKRLKAHDTRHETEASFICPNCQTLIDVPMSIWKIYSIHNNFYVLKLK